MLFLHNTSRVEDEPYPTLLRDKGFGGFPSLAFMDAEGEVLAQPKSRDVAGFETTLAALKRWQELAAADDRSAAEEVELFLAELDLGKLSLEEANARYAKLEGLTDEQKVSVDNEIILLEVQAAAREAGRDREKLGVAFKAMAEAGRVPKGPNSLMFYFTLMGYAANTSDAALLEKTLAAAHAEFDADERYARYLKRFDDELAKLKEQDG